MDCIGWGGGIPSLQLTTSHDQFAKPIGKIMFSSSSSSRWRLYEIAS